MVVYCIVVLVITLFFMNGIHGMEKSISRNPEKYNQMQKWSENLPVAPIEKSVPSGVYHPVSPQVLPAYWPVRKVCSSPEWVVTAYAKETIPSPAEELIITELKKYDLVWEREVSFHGFYNEQGWLHRYDFYLPDYSIVIEYNGKDWHYLPGKIETDRIKAEYLQDNNIELIVWSTPDYYHIEDRVYSLMNRLAVSMK
jgi:hypothetical protein